MPLLSKVLNSTICLKLGAIDPPILTIEDLLTRDPFITSNGLGISIEEFIAMKLQVAGQLLKVEGNSLAHWRELPAAIPDMYDSSNLRRTSGISSLDCLFGGGFPSNSVTQILGKAESGKTHITFSMSVACALLGLKVMVVSTCNDFSAKRLQYLIEKAISANEDKFVSQNQQQDAVLYALSNVYIQTCYDLWSLLDLLCRITELKMYDVVIIDCLHHILTPVISSNIGSYNSKSFSSTSISNNNSVTSDSSSVLCSLLNQLGLLLRALRCTGATVVVTNVLTSATSIGSSTVMSNSGSSYHLDLRNGQGSHTAALPYCTGVHGALIDIFDAIIVLQKTNTSNKAPLLTTAISNVNPAITGSNTIINAVVVHRPSYLKALPSTCEFVIS